MGLYLPEKFLKFKDNVAAEVMQEIRDLNFKSRKNNNKLTLGPSAFIVDENTVKLVGYEATGIWLKIINGMLKDKNGVLS